MIEKFFHNSQDAEYRFPFGAAKCGEAVVLRFQAAADSGVERVELCLFREGQSVYSDMQRLTEGGGQSQRFELRLTVPDQPCLLWYFFQMHTPDGLCYYGNNREQEGGVGAIYRENPPAYQLTVHNNAKPLPDWFRRGIVYQIFVDRFANGMPDGKILSPKKGCLVHPHWDDDPIYIRERETGRILAYDFFGGNLAGILDKLPYLAELGVSAIYLNPIFEAPSNHKYDTADYKKIDAMFGTAETFRQLCGEAAKLGIAVILDGVFSHTGSDSVYFNKLGTYPGVGAFQSPDSPYYSWYRFHHYPHEYAGWWGIDTMPEVDEMEPSYQDFIARGPDSVIRHWMRQGVKGWRLDVADELPDAFIKELSLAAKAAEPEAVIIGEVWEDASNKVSYGELRQYLGGSELDSVTNYPFRTLVLHFLLGKLDSAAVGRKLMSLCENYPKVSFYGALNLLGTHDVARVLTVLCGDGLSGEAALALARRRLKLASLWQMTFPGVPCIYYGDEAGVTGGEDPLNRRTFPWGREDGELLSWYKIITAARRRYAVLTEGDWRPLAPHPDVFGFVRATQDNTAVILLNRSAETQRVTVRHPACRGLFFNLAAHEAEVPLGDLPISLGPLEGKLLIRRLASAPKDCGVLLHLTSLPGEHGIGDMGDSARRFIDFLQQAGQSYWQILPLSPPDDGNSPYTALSAFAGNPLLISPDELVADGFLTQQEVTAMRDKLLIGAVADNVDFALVREYKEKLLRRAFAAFSPASRLAEWQHLLDDNAFWLDDFALFMALKREFDNAPWSQWPEKARRRDPVFLSDWAARSSEEIEYQRFVQFVFWRQWQKLLEYAHGHGIQIIGDLPIFVAYDSADVWSQTHLFELDSAGHPCAVAGVPPDYFSEEGQLWGNPLYDWEAAAKDDYRWWRERFAFLLGKVDVIRIDHFRGFEAFWSVPAEAETAREGNWIKGPGEKFFMTLKKYLGALPVIAEDLGVITPEVTALRKAAGLPGMKVLQFLFGYTDNGEFAPLGIDEDTVVYPGTHDNNTTAGWYRSLRETDPAAMESLSQYLGLADEPPEAEIVWGINELAYQSKARTAILALQDVLALGPAARMNIPGTVSAANWSWRCPEKLLNQGVAVRLARLAEKHKRGRSESEPGNR